MQGRGLPLLVLLALAATAGPRWPVELPLKMEKNLPLAQIKVNQTQNLLFILDSAAAGCVLDKTRAAELGLRPTGTAISSGSGGAQQTGIVNNVELNIGGLILQQPRCYLFDMKALGFKGAVEGIIGHPLFSKYVVEIDYPASRARIIDPTSFRPSPKVEVIAMRMTIGPVVRGKVRLKGRPPVDADMQLDTGSAHVITMCTEFVDREKLMDSAENLTPGSTRGFGGEAADMVGEIEGIQVGSFTEVKPTVRFSRQTTGTLNSERYYSANLGGGFLKKYKVTFDFPARRLLIEVPVPQPAEEMGVRHAPHSR